MAIFDKAKQLRDDAKAKATELAEQASQRATEAKDQAVQKASDMKDQAAQKAADVKTNIATAAADVKEGATNAAQAAKETVANAATAAADASVAKVKETMADFNEALPVIQQAGYRVTGVDIGIGIPPKVSASVSVAEEVTPERLAEILETNKDKKLTVLIVRALHQAWRLNSAIKIAGMRPRGMSIELGLIPNVSIKFGPVEGREAAGKVVEPTAPAEPPSGGPPGLPPAEPAS